LGEDENHPMALTYINGKLSGASFYDVKNDHFESSPEGPATLQIFGSKAQIKIYGIRVYSSALSHRTIAENYMATLPTLQEK
jgi:hypothetical protein